MELARSKPNSALRSVYAVWKWPRWMWCLMLTMAAAGYVLSPPLITMLLNNVQVPVMIGTILEALYYPITVAHESVPGVAMFYHSEYSMFDQVFGSNLLGPTAIEYLDTPVDAPIDVN